MKCVVLAALLLVGCGLEPCRDTVLNPQAWYGNSQCVHPQQELKRESDGTWTCICKGRAK